MVSGVSTVGVVLIAWALALVLVIGWLWLRGAPRTLGTMPADPAPAERRVRGERRTMNLGPPPGMPDRRSGLDRRGSVATG